MYSLKDRILLLRLRNVNSHKLNNTIVNWIFSFSLIQHSEKLINSKSNFTTFMCLNGFNLLNYNVTKQRQSQTSACYLKPMSSSLQLLSQKPNQSEISRDLINTYKDCAMENGRIVSLLESQKTLQSLKEVIKNISKNIKVTENKFPRLNLIKMNSDKDDQQINKPDPKRPHVQQKESSDMQLEEESPRNTPNISKDFQSQLNDTEEEEPQVYDISLTSLHLNWDKVRFNNWATSQNITLILMPASQDGTGMKEGSFFILITSYPDLEYLIEHLPDEVRISDTTFITAVHHHGHVFRLDKELDG